jgi:PAS domain S-box-containing protein
VPLMRDGRLTATLYLHHGAPRPWSDADAALAESVAERTWSAVERARAEADLRAARARAEALAAERAAVLGQLAEGVIVTDPEGRITFVNEAAARLHGVARLDVPPEAYSETYRLFTEDGRPYPPAELPLARAVLRGETVTDERWRVRRPDGTEVLAIGSARPLRAADGSALGAVLTVRDDTAREAAERALREGEARFRAIVEDQTEFISRLAPDLTITFVNRAYAAQLGRPPERLLGTSMLDLMTPEQRARFTEGLARLTPEAPVASYEMDTVLPDGTPGWEHWTDRALFDAAGRLVGYQSVGRDVTGAKRAEAQRELLLAELSHRVKNTLAVVQGIASRSLTAGRPP